MQETGATGVYVCELLVGDPGNAKNRRAAYLLREKSS
jgi:hypothetical protein